MTAFWKIATKDLAWRVKILTSACDVEFAADCRPCSKFSAITHTKLTAVEIRSIPHGKQFTSLIRSLISLAEGEICRDFIEILKG